MLGIYYMYVHIKINSVEIDWYMYFVGAGTAMLGKEGAMACTVAVEAVIGEHYNRYQ